MLFQHKVLQEYIEYLCCFIFSNVLASYSRFLWETEEDEDEDKDEGSDNHKYGFQYFHGVVAAPNA